MQFSFYQERISNFVCCFWLSLGYFKYKFNLRIVFLIGIMWTFIIVKFQIIQKTNTHNILIPNIKIQTQKSQKKKNLWKTDWPVWPTDWPDPTRHFAGRVLVDTIFVPGSKNPYLYSYFFFGFGLKNGSGSNFARSREICSVV